MRNFMTENQRHKEKRKQFLLHIIEVNSVLLKLLYLYMCDILDHDVKLFLWVMEKLIKVLVINHAYLGIRLPGFRVCLTYKFKEIKLYTDLSSPIKRVDAACYCVW